MRCNKSVTIYHFEASTKQYVRYFVPYARVHKTLFVAVDQRGFSNDSAIKIRVPGKAVSEEMVALGDYVFLGEAESAVPQKQRCFKVIGTAENFYGKNPHFRIFAK